MDGDCFGFIFNSATSTCYFGVIGQDISSHSPPNSILYLDAEGISINPILNGRSSVLGTFEY